MAEEQKIALEQFRNVVGYLQYENMAYWTRSGFLLATQAALLGFSARVVPTSTNALSAPAIAICVCLAVVALIICWIGLKMINNSITWIDRWIQILREIEPLAYGDRKVFRGTETSYGDPGKHFARDTAKYLIFVFVVAWLALLVYAGYLFSQLR
jgi:uncharacterized protein involved in cysteine biosynthesis